MEPGGTKGGETLFLWGLGIFLLGFGAYLFLDSVRLTAGHGGLISGFLGRRGGGGGMSGTVSNMLIFTPVVTGIIILFYDASKKWAWWIVGAGLAFIIVEVVSNTRFMVDLKVSHMIVLLLMMSGGTGLILRSYVQTKALENEEQKLIESDDNK